MMTRDHTHGHRHTRYLDRVTSQHKPVTAIRPGLTPPDAGVQELEARLLLSASGLDKQALSDIDAWLNRPVVSVDLSDQAGCSGPQGIVAPGDDYGNNAADSTFVQTDTTIFGDIEITSDQDWFNFQGQAGITYTFATELLGIIDTSLVLYDTDGTTVLAFDDDGGPGLASLLNWTAPSQGTYYLAARGFDTQTGAYSLSMSDTAIPTGEIRGTKWDDLNQDGIRDLNEPGLEGWRIFIDENRNRKRDQGERFVLTDVNGDYVFANMRPGIYTIAEKPKPGWQQTSPGPGGATASSNPAIAGFGTGGALIHSSTVTASNPTNGSGEAVFFDNPTHSEPDGSGPIGFTPSGSQWPQPGGLGTTVVITYSYSNLLNGGLLGGLSPAAIQTGIEEALALWSSFAPLKFVEVPDTGPMPDEIETPYNPAEHPDIRFGHHPDDDNSGELAHAYYPMGTGLSGDVHFNNTDTWSIGQQSGAFDLIEVAVHEIGHSVGLGHEEIEDALMNPVYASRYSGFGTSFLLDDDVAGIQSIYGEVQALLGVWSVTIHNPGEIAEGIDFGSFLNDDHGNDQENATPVSPPTLITGNIESLGDIDWFTFDAGQGQAFSFETLLTTGIEDTVIRLIDQDGTTLIGTDDDGGISLASKLPWVAPSAGTYYLEVSGFAANIGDYTLRLAAAPTGDLNIDGFVGVEDLDIVLSFFNQTVPVGELLSGDPSFDGFVGIADLNIVLGNWNNGTQPPAASQDTGGESLATANDGDSNLGQTQSDQDLVAATDQSTRRVRSATPARESDPQRHPTQESQVNRLALGHDTQAALAAWSRNPSRIVAHDAAAAFTYASESDDSEGLLGLWSGDAEG